MPSTRKQKVKARKSREMEILSDYSNKDVRLGEGNSNTSENVEKCSKTLSPYQIESVLPKRTKSRILAGRDLAGCDRLTESIEISSDEMNARLSQEIDSLMGTMQSRSLGQKVQQ